MGADTRGTARRGAEKAVITVWLKRREGGLGRRKPPP